MLSHELKHVSSGGKFKLSWKWTQDKFLYYLYYLTREDAQEFAARYVEPTYGKDYKITELP